MARIPLLAAAVLAVAAPSQAGAATLSTEAACYLPGEAIEVAGAGWAPGSDWTVSGAFTADGVTDDIGAFSFAERAPMIADTTVPRTFRLSGTENGEIVARASFKVVSFLVVPKNVKGNPTGKTPWRFSGFAPGQPIFIHVQRKGRTYTQKVGRGDTTCGRLKTRVRRLPAVPQREIGFGTYKLFVDNRSRFTKGGLQYRAKIKLARD